MAIEDSLDIFSPDPLGRDYLYGLSTGQERLGLQPPPQGLPVDTRPYDRMQATPRSFISGLFSDVLGGTLNMPSMPRTGVPSLDLLYANRNPLFNLMGVGDVQKTAERISYGEPLATGSGMTLKPREETIFAGMAVAPLVGEAANLGARVGRAGARIVGQGIAENVAMGRPNLPSMFAEPRSSLFAVEPSPSMAAADESSAMRQQLTGKMQALLAQKKVATSAVEVGAINQQIGELQAQFKSLPTVQRVAREVVAPEITAPVSDLGFYSAAEQAAMNLERSKGTGQSFLNDLMNAPDVKKDELSWIGLDDFLKDKPNVTKQEVQDFIASNKIDLQEVRLGEQPPYDKIRLATLENELSQLKEHPIDAPTFGEEKFNELLKLQNIRDQSTVDSLYSGAEVAIRNAQRAQAAGNKELANKYFLESEMFNTRAEALDLQGLGVPNPTRYSNYQLAGGENYREILLKMPNHWDKPRAAQIANEERIKALRQEMYGTSGTNEIRSEISRLQNENTALQKQISEASIYKSSHFDEPNILAHMRVNDRIDADGKKMLLVEEIQSDWHQAGRETGYNKKLTQAESDELRNLQKKEQDEDGLFQDDIQRINELEKKSMGGVPDAPFKDTWYQLALKRVMKYAADNGYERVGLTTGEQQAKRYDLSKQVDELLYKKNADGTYQLSAQANGRGNMLGESIPENKLSDYVGKEVATKIAENSGRELNLGANNQPKDMWKGLSGIDLKVGGEGMKKYYDEIYPKFLEKYSKKWDASVGDTKISTEASPKSWAYFRDWFSKNHSDVGGSSTALANWEQGENSKYVREFLKQNKVQEPIRYIDITPKMKEGVKKGQPLASAEQTPEMLASGGLDYADPFKNPLLESTIG